VFPNWRYGCVADTVIPELRKRGVSAEQIHQMMVLNAKRGLLPKSVAMRATEESVPAPA
jgi:phosphotriesterase-related protein